MAKQFTKTAEDYGVDLGGFLDDVDVEIINTWFDYPSAEYAKAIEGGSTSRTIQIFHQFSVDGADQSNPQGFSIGTDKEWEISKDGRSVVNKKNPEKHQFRKGSRAGDFCWGLLEAMGNGNLEVGKNVAAEVGNEKKAFFTDADYWEGMNLHLDSKDLPVVGGGTKSVPIPSMYYGSGKGAGSKKSDDNSGDLEQLLVDNASGKTLAELRKFAVQNKEIKKDSALLQDVVKGSKLSEMEDAGKIIMDPDTERYV